MHFKYPQGIILSFDTACPTGWTRVNAFDNKFLRGADTYDGTGGGSTSHDHTFNPGIKDTSYSMVHNSDKGDTTYSILNIHYHSVNIASTTSESADHIPPYVNVVFCKKD